MELAHQRILLDIAKQSVAHGIANRQPLPIDINTFDKPLRAVRATFVTLRINNQLRGCIGTLEAHRPLIEDVAHNAFAAAFGDPRFSPVLYHESLNLDYHISILSPPEPMVFSDEADLLAQIRPNVDGLILSDAGRRGTFLPSVWEQLPDTQTFWLHLKRKAGLPDDHWSPTVQVSRYTAEDVH